MIRIIVSLYFYKFTSFNANECRISSLLKIFDGIERLNEADKSQNNGCDSEELYRTSGDIKKDEGLLFIYLFTLILM